jgi:UDP-N-acetyl-D-mannosaminuronic acid dehydrogenase
VIPRANRHPHILLPGPGVGGHCIAFKANIDDFRQSPARLVAGTLAQTFGSCIQVVEPYAAERPIEFTDTVAKLIDIDTALEECDLLVVLVDHDVFRVVPLAERAGKLVYDTRGIWPDQPRPIPDEAPGLRLAS